MSRRCERAWENTQRKVPSAGCSLECGIIRFGESHSEFRELCHLDLGKRFLVHRSFRACGVLFEALLGTRSHTKWCSCGHEISSPSVAGANQSLSEGASEENMQRNSECYLSLPFPRITTTPAVTEPKTSEKASS